MKKLSICLFALLWYLSCVLMAQSGLHGKVEYLVIEDFDWHDSTGLPAPDVYNACRAELLFDARRAFCHEYFEMDEEKREAIMQKELERLKQEAAEADEEGRKELNLTIEVPSSNKHYYVLTERQPAPVRLTLMAWARRSWV
ncbi:hypothetical protein [Thermonema rossianum]|uniref:hypothetical protein n=1 Tax=Thermonema rossianum TaxID=55505 RepID=UPI000571F876|nr:hypothetical protein [Thermonema rossianum]